MANTYTQLHVQIVFAVQNRLSLIKSQWRDELNKYYRNYSKSSTLKIYKNPTFAQTD